jgi:hypothetical protein
MALWEVHKYGADTFADPEYTCLYGMRPAEWYERGIRLLARTTVECVRDTLGDQIGQDVERILHGAPPAAGVTVIDPFAGSCNSLYWILRHVPASRGIAFELDDVIFDMTMKNVGVLDLPIELLHGDYRSLLPVCDVPADQFLVVFVAPPWGDAMSEQTGLLDLRHTQPPIADIVEYIERVYPSRPILYVTQVRQYVDPAALAELASRFEWSDLRMYDINAEGMKPGILLGSRRWQPRNPM